jgi:hypothetical protein
MLGAQLLKRHGLSLRGRHRQQPKKQQQADAATHRSDLDRQALHHPAFPTGTIIIDKVSDNKAPSN